MNLVYGAFAIVISIAIISNVVIRLRFGQALLRSDTFIWSVNSLPYLILFIVMMSYNTAPFLAICTFHVLASMCYVWQFRMLEFKKHYVTNALPIGLVLFILAWTFMSYYLEMQSYVILVPSVVVSAVVSLMMSAYFFMRSDREIQLKSVIAILYAILAMVKFMYLIETGVDDVINFIGFFILDFMIYLMTAVLILINSYYRQLVRHTARGQVVADMLEYAKDPIALLNHKGQLLFANDYLKNDLEAKGLQVKDIEALLKLYAGNESSEWLADVLEGFYSGESSFFSLSEDLESGLQAYIFCDIVPAKRDYNILFSLRAYPAEGAWTGEGRRSIDQLALDDRSSRLSLEFEDILISEVTQKLGLMLVRMTNYVSIENKLGSELCKDFIARIVSDLKDTQGVAEVRIYKEGTLVVMTEDRSFEAIHTLAEVLVHKMAEAYTIANHKVSLSPDIGVAIYPDNGLDFDALSKAAQMALSRNATGHGHRVQFYHSEYKFLESDRAELENDLRNAISNNAFTMLYQPQVTAKDQDFRGFEALIRWETSSGKSVSPNIFIPLAENLGIIEEVGLWVLENAISNAALWQEEFGVNFMISVNISSYQLEKTYFIDQVRDLLDQYHYKPFSLELEVTESKILRTSKEVYTSLKAFKEMGVKIALDDFGTGYSSLDYLRWLPFDVLKIDKSFVDSISGKTVEREIVQSVISLVNKLTLETVAEGVENQEQLNFLQSCGCTYIQGYLFSEPLTEFEARETLLKID